jgi:peptidoglycan L-alanyl-D-glutamate endopeptidase CwlK
MKEVIARLAVGGLVFKIISGTRTYGEQNELFAQGRMKPGPIVTRARGGQSNHKFGVVLVRWGEHRASLAA